MKKTRFNNLILPALTLTVMLFIYGCSEKKKEEKATEAKSEQSAEVQKPDGEWISLFDGKTLNGWKQYGHDEITELWKAEDGMIVCYGEGHGEADGEMRGSLITKDHFGNFELELEWKISPTGNSGILYHVVEKPEYGHAYDTGPEYQLIDDEGFPAKLKDAQKTGSAYDMYAAPADKKLNPPGEWNTSKIVYKNGHVVHWLNGEKIIEYDENSDDFKTRYENSKWVEYPGWNKYKEGAIGLQDHGSKIWFRNIRIKKL